MRPLYMPFRSPPAGLAGVLLGALLLTLGVFLILPLSQMVSARRQDMLNVRPVERIQFETAPEAETPPAPPPEAEKPPEPPPTLTEAAPPLHFNVSLDAVFGGGGGLATTASWLQETVAQMSGLDAFSIADLERRPEVLNAVPPVYPESLRKARVEGSVTLAFVLSESGHIEDLRVESSTHKDFEVPALDAIRRWKFKPGLKNGEPVRTFLRQTIRFQVSGTVAQ